MMKTVFLGGHRAGFRTGFTLIEIVISMAILLIGIVAILALFPVGFDSATRAADLTQAATLALDKLGDIKRLGYPAYAQPETAYTELEYSRFRSAVIVNEHPRSGYLPANCQWVTVRILWNYRGKDVYEDFDTLITKLEP